MKLAAEQREFETSMDLKSESFQIKASPKAFQILSDSLYQNKELAILRELIANAVDAHVDAGTTDTAFEIHLPTILEPYFEVKDFGTGLADSDIKALYTTYFGSNKTGTNDLIGGLGLGSKSPFAYADQFTVVSRFNGIETRYQIYKDATGMPTVSAIASTPTEEANGLTVNVPIPEQGFRAFQEAAQTILPHVTIPFVQKGATYDIPEPTEYVSKFMVDVDDLKFEVMMKSDKERSGYYRDVSVRALMGIIPYKLTDIPSSRVAYALRHLNIDIRAPIGALDIAASRETLSFNEMTLHNLDIMTIGIAVHVIRDMKKVLAGSPNALLYMKKREELVRGFTQFLAELNRYSDSFEKAYPDLAGEIKRFMGSANTPMTWNNQPIMWTIPADINIRRIIKAGGNWRQAAKVDFDYDLDPGKTLDADNIWNLLRAVMDDDGSVEAFWSEKKRPYKAFFEQGEFENCPALVITGDFTKFTRLMAELGVTNVTKKELPLIRNTAGSRFAGSQTYPVLVYPKGLNDDAQRNSEYWTLNQLVDHINEKHDGEFNRVVIKYGYGYNYHEVFNNKYLKPSKTAQGPVYFVRISEHHVKKIAQLEALGALNIEDGSTPPAEYIDTEYTEVSVAAEIRHNKKLRLFLSMFEHLWESVLPRSREPDQALSNVRNTILMRSMNPDIRAIMQKIDRLYKLVRRAEAIELPPLKVLDDTVRDKTAIKLEAMVNRIWDQFDAVDEKYNHLDLLLYAAGSDMSLLASRDTHCAQPLIKALIEGTNND